MMLIDSSKKKWATAHLSVFRPRCSQCEPGRNDRSAGSDSSKSLIIFEPSARCNAKTLVKNGIAIPLWYFQRRDAAGNYVPSPLVNDMPAFQDVYAEVQGSDRSSIEWKALELLSDLYGASNFVLGPQGMDAAATSILRNAMAKTMADADFIGEQKKIFGFPHEYVNLDEVQNIVARIGSVRPELVEFFQKLMK